MDQGSDETAPSVADDAQPLKPVVRDVARGALADAAAQHAPDRRRVLVYAIRFDRAAATPAERQATAERRRIAVADAIAATLGVASADVVVAHELGGRPRVAAPTTALSISLSHSGSRSAIALANAPIGIDLEEPRARAYDALAPHAFVASEAAWLAAQPDREAAFLRLWTAKEATLKAAGTGLAGGLANVVLEPARDVVTLRKVPASLGAATDWRLVALDAAFGCPACLACARAVDEVVVLRVGDA